MVSRLSFDARKAESNVAGAEASKSAFLDGGSIFDDVTLFPRESVVDCEMSRGIKDAFIPHSNASAVDDPGAHLSRKKPRAC